MHELPARASDLTAGQRIRADLGNGISAGLTVTRNEESTHRERDGSPLREIHGLGGLSIHLPATAIVHVQVTL